MRVLINEHGVAYEEAWTLVTGCFAYTNHTVMSEALETWSLEMMEAVLPWWAWRVRVRVSITQIIFDINWSFMQLVQREFQHDPALLEIMGATSIFTNDANKRVRKLVRRDVQVQMAHLCVIGSHVVNGVSELHTRILRESVFRRFEQVTPGKIINITNGITPRRWLLQCNPCTDHLFA